METLPPDHNGLYSKWSSYSDQRSLRIAVLNGGNFFVQIGYNGGASQETLYSASTLVTGRFYHYGFTFDDTDKSWKLVVWDDTGSTKIINTSGTATNNISVEAIRVAVGVGYFESAGNNPRMPFDGETDEVVVFKDILTTGEIDQIRQGTYGS